MTTVEVCKRHKWEFVGSRTIERRRITPIKTTISFTLKKLYKCAQCGKQKLES